jgi:predicted TIM-barrel fold metal-dependent hydrolase
MHIVPRAHDAIERRRANSIRICAGIDPLAFLDAAMESDEDDLFQNEMREAVAGAAKEGAVAIELWMPAMGARFSHAAIAEMCAAHRLPLRFGDRAVIARLAQDHSDTSFVLAALGDDPYWESTIASVAALTNVAVDISGARTERGMLDRALAVLGPERLLWGTGAQMETGLAQLRALDVIAPGADVIEAIRWKNAFRIFPKLAEPA